MEPDIATESDVIEALGGSLQAAILLGCGQSNILWMLKRGIPAHHDDRIVEAAPGISREMLAGLRKHRREAVTSQN